MSRRALRARRTWMRGVLGAAIAAATAEVALVACSGSGSGVSGGARDDAAVRDASPGRDADAEASTPDEAATDASGSSDASCVGQPDLDAAYYVADAEICPVMLPCGLPGTLALSGCQVVSTSAGGAAIGCNLLPSSGCEAGAPIAIDASLTIQCLCDIFAAGGRMPPGWSRGVAAPGAPLARALATMAMEESASIDAFEQLAGALAALGAPAALVVAARRSARDERRHARRIGAEAARFGGAPPSPRRRAPRPIDAAALARDNARAGCVRETFAALVAAWQAERAADPRLRRVLAGVARDEARHAALAWSLADWLEPRLDARARRGAARARRDALRALRRDVSTARLSAEPTLGSPSRADAARLLEALELAIRARS